MSSEMYYSRPGNANYSKEELCIVTDMFGVAGVSIFQSHRGKSLKAILEYLNHEKIEIFNSTNKQVNKASFINEYIVGFSRLSTLYRLGLIHGAGESVEYGYHENSPSDFWSDTETGALFTSMRLSQL